MTRLFPGNAVTGLITRSFGGAFNTNNFGGVVHYMNIPASTSVSHSYYGLMGPINFYGRPQKQTAQILN
jgi:hypothetical protein